MCGLCVVSLVVVWWKLLRKETNFDDEVNAPVIIHLMCPLVSRAFLSGDRKQLLWFKVSRLSQVPEN